jgi:hypothetical protein
MLTLVTDFLIGFYTVTHTVDAYMLLLVAVVIVVGAVTFMPGMPHLSPMGRVVLSLLLFGLWVLGALSLLR